MPIERRDLLKAGIATGIAAALEARVGLAQGRELNLKRIPASGEMIPPIGIGTNRYGVGQSEDERAPLRATMARFVELGGKVMDTASIYGTSEVVIGDIAEQLGIRDDLFLATKTDIRGQVRGATGLENAMRRLKTEIDVMLVHNLVNAATEVPVMREWQQEGRIRYIGASISTPDQFDQMERFMRDNDVQVVQFNYSLGDRLAAERLLPTAADRGIAVMINVPFGGGGRSSLFDVVEGRDLPDWAAEIDCTSWSQFFLKYIVSHPAVTCAIPGTRRVEYVDDNFGAALGRMPDAAFRRRQEQFFDGIA
jgi:aryl-alcohol dehydrogenase-like predicted oxidoreductase